MLVSDAGHRFPIRLYTNIYNQPGYKYLGDVSGLQAGQKRKSLPIFIQDNMKGKTLSMVKVSGTEGKQECRDVENLFSGQFSSP